MEPVWPHDGVSAGVEACAIVAGPIPSRVAGAAYTRDPASKSERKVSDVILDFMGVLL